MKSSGYSPLSKLGGGGVRRVFPHLSYGRNMDTMAMVNHQCYLMPASDPYSHWLNCKAIVHSHCANIICICTYVYM